MESSIITDAALDRALMLELCSGRRFMEANERFREEDCEAEAAKYRGAKSTEILGKHVATIPQHEFFTVAQKEGGTECWHDRGFLRDFQRHFPNLATGKV